MSRWDRVVRALGRRARPDDPPPVRYTYVGGPVRDQPDAALPLMPGGEFTSARLRRVEQERDQWKAAARSWSDRYAEACRAGHVLQAELVSARAELEQLRAATNDKEKST